MHMPGLQLVGQHFACQAPVRRQYVQPRHDDVVQPITSWQGEKRLRGAFRQYGLVRPVEPGLDQVIFLRVVLAYLIQRYLQRIGDGMQAHIFPGRRLAKLERLVQYPLSEIFLV